MKNLLNKAPSVLIPLVCAFITGGKMAVMQIPAAYAWRGYHAVGGEWLLIIAAAVAGFWIGAELDKALVKLEGR